LSESYFFSRYLLYLNLLFKFIAVINNAFESKLGVLCVLGGLARKKEKNKSLIPWREKKGENKSLARKNIKKTPCINLKYKI